MNLRLLIRHARNVVIERAIIDACTTSRGLPIARPKTRARSHWSVREAVTYATCLVALWPEVA